METDNITILEEDLESARTLCGSILDSKIRNRAVANVVGAKIASRYFDKNIQVDSDTGLHNIVGILEKFDISDLYVNNSYVDVRVYFNSDELSIPKLHFDLDILPVVYMFIKLNTNLSIGNVVGFIRPENVSKDNLEQGYYYITEDSLSSYYDIESHLSATTLDMSDIPNELLYKYAENDIDNDKQISLVRELIKSKLSRIKLAKIIKAQSVFTAVSIPENKEQVSGDSEQMPLSEGELESLFVSEDEEVTDEDQLFQNLEYSTEVTPSNSDLLNEDSNFADGMEPDGQEAENDDIQNSEEIDTLFNEDQKEASVVNKKSSPLTVILLLLLFIGCGYFVYTNYFIKTTGELPQNSLPDMNNEIRVDKPIEPQKEDAMPIETVEATQPAAVQKAKQEEAVSVAIPAIEKHLDASVLVSNLRVEWAIPSGYINNSSAKHYLFKLGKIIQLNLKTELLLLSKPPLSSKITVELTYNANIGKFELVGIKDSSGEKTVDDAIIQTIKSVLDMHINSNTETFGKLTGNPVLIIRL